MDTSEGAIKIEVSLPGRDHISLNLELNQGVISRAKLSGSGCPEMLRLFETWRPKLKGAVRDLPVPEGLGHADLLMREAILKAKGEWQFPYDEEELCHCRVVPTAKVDAAIISGCRTVRAVARETSAGTSCGSCRPNTEAIIAFRCGRV